MAHRSRLVTWCLALCGWLWLMSDARAGYALLAPPSGYTSSGTERALFRASAANGDTWTGQTVRTNASLNVGGQAVKVPATMRLAANAGRYAAAASFGWPGLFLAAGMAAYDWYTAQRITVREEAGVKGWYKARDLPGEGEWWIQGNTGWQHASTIMAAAALGWPGYQLESQGPGCVGVWAGFWISACGEWRQETPTETIYDKLTKDQFVEAVSTYPNPVIDPGGYPVPVDWPVEVPLINPSPAGVPQPMRVPTGDPQLVPFTPPYPAIPWSPTNPDGSPNLTPNPNLDPNPVTWRQPVVDIVPSPTVAEPWRVSVTPKDIITESPTAPAPMPSPVTVPAPDPANPTSEQPKTPGLCDEYPDILACQVVKLTALVPDEVKNTDKALEITKDTGWGPDNGSCPPPRTATVMGMEIAMPFTGLCDFANAIRPIVIGLAWVSAALVFFGLGRKSG